MMKDLKCPECSWFISYMVNEGTCACITCGNCHKDHTVGEWGSGDVVNALVLSTTETPLVQDAPGDVEDEFGGVTYERAEDFQRLSTQLRRVFGYMQDRGWHRLAETAHACGGSEASVSARIRDFRKHKFGAHIVNRRRCGSGLWEYQLISSKAGLIEPQVPQV